MTGGYIPWAMTLALLLLWQPAGAEADQCRMTSPCFFDCGDVVMDMTALKPISFHDVLGSKHLSMFFYSPCSTFTLGPDCVNTYVCEQDVILGTRTDIGSSFSASLSSPGGNNHFIYTHNSTDGEQKTTNVTVVCGPPNQVTDPQLQVEGRDPIDINLYEMTLTSHHAYFQNKTSTTTSVLTTEVTTHKHNVTTAHTTHKHNVTTAHTTHKHNVTTAHTTHKHNVTTAHTTHKHNVTTAHTTHKHNVTTAYTIHKHNVTTAHTTHKHNVTTAHTTHKHNVTTAHTTHKHNVTTAHTTHKHNVTTVHTTPSKHNVTTEPRNTTTHVTTPAGHNVTTVITTHVTGNMTAGHQTTQGLMTTSPPSGADDLSRCSAERVMVVLLMATVTALASS